MIEGQFKPYQKFQFGDLELPNVEDIPFTVAFQASAVSNGSTITWPSVQAGDIAYLFDTAANNSGSPTLVTPSGFTSIVSESWATFWASGISRRICDGSETGSITGMDGTNSENKVLLVFRGTHPVASVTNSTPTTQGTTGNPTSQNINASGQVTPLIVFGMVYAGSASVAFATETPSFDATVTDALNRLRVGYKIYNASPANHTIDQADQGSANYLAGFYSRLSN